MNPDLNETKEASCFLRHRLSELSPDLFKRVCELETKVATNALPFKLLPKFGDQGLIHAKAVQYNLGRLIPRQMSEPLTPFELFVLLSATVLHDVGLVMPRPPDEVGREISIDHYNRSKEFVDKYRAELNLSRYEAFIIGELSRAHGMPNLKYLEGEPFSLTGYGDVRVPLLSALLRLADALDITVHRIPGEVSRSSSLPKKSRRVRLLHSSISDVKISTAPSWDIIVVCTPPKKSIEFASYKLRNSIQRELDNVSPILRGAGIFFKKVDLSINRLPLKQSKSKKSKSKKSERVLKNPFIRLAYFTQREAYLYAGREKEAKELFERIVDNNLILVIGESGVGKTSLVEASVIPKLKSFGCRTIRFSFQEDPIGSLIDGLYDFARPNHRAKPIGERNSHATRNLLQAIQIALSKRKNKKSKLIIIGDHLEQMFTVSMESRAREDFVSQFSQVLAKLSADLVTFLFCIRQDYLPNLYDLSHDIPQFYKRDNTFKLYRLSEENGKEVLKRASKHARLKLSKPLIDRIVDGLRQEGDGMIYPPFLQIVGYSLYDAIPKRYYRSYFGEVPEDLYDTLGGVKNIVKRYLESLLDSYTQEDKAMVVEILKKMVTDYQTKRRVTKAELERDLPHCHKLEDFLQTLIKNRIVQRTLGEYELISDVLAEKVIEMIRTHHKFLSPPVRRALKYIEKNYYEQNLTSGEIAEAAGVSQIHLAALFRNQLGRSINSQLNHFRIAKAKEMLGNSLDPIADVAKEAGFRSLSAFSRKFREIDGSSPLVYRNRLKAQLQVSGHLMKVEPE